MGSSDALPALAPPSGFHWSIWECSTRATARAAVCKAARSTAGTPTSVSPLPQSVVRSQAIHLFHGRAGTHIPLFNWNLTVAPSKDSRTRCSDLKRDSWTISINDLGLGLAPSLERKLRHVALQLISSPVTFWHVTWKTTLMIIS